MGKGQFKTAALLALLSGLLVAIGYALYGTTGAILGLVMAAVTNFGSWFYSDEDRVAKLLELEQTLDAKNSVSFGV